jgi:putative ABC transport system permease protein
MSLSLTGIAPGLLVSLAVTRVLSDLLYGIKPSDPQTFSAVTLFLVAIAVVASLLPAIRTASIEPIQALRTE